MAECEAPFDAKTVAKLLGIALSTLNGWLATDETRRPEDRRFSFHNYRGRKRIWTAEAFEALTRAIEAESERGGVLGKWRGDVGSGDVPDADVAKHALEQVLNFKVRANAPGKPPRRVAAADATQRITPDEGDQWSRI